tara:strand:- start:161 stop:1219 length:1059 start_codon:yes stop_codon:yes gene_type:complete
MTQQRRTKLAIIGAGNAGCITALHFRKWKPDLEIDLYHASTHHPIERVGQGTIVAVTQLLSDTLGSTWFKNDLGATLKTGILYRDFGTKQEKIFHDFYSLSSVSIHYTPKKLSDCVLSSGLFNIKEEELDNLEDIDADFVIDCRGKKHIDEENVNTIVNPINSVLLASLPKKEMSWTESRATPNGWCFTLPIEDKLSLGYLYNAGLTSKEEATKDFQKRFGVEHIEHSMKFANYCSTNPFSKSGKVLKNGNSSVFIEPLEATATGLYLWIARIGFDFFIDKKELSQCLHLFHKEVNAVAHFILWHYKTGSKFNSPFWSYVDTIPFTEIKIPTGEESYGQWQEKSFRIWKNNT